MMNMLMYVHMYFLFDPDLIDTHFSRHFIIICNKNIIYNNIL